ncbi:glycosyltransferase family 4 protein [Phormidium sp. CCY1219]|uniref:glycosyltransferase family 4 protein n=1 Tax=Phormidium sp. CCY1219 TaxID=2886104 RepID=UPI002D1E5F48|nr:glycosyltransferase family 4 protein [Phormidium sp. CCY1219]MEB3827617.1 glycosyltransferase family 4 protein [Phormidium sp. CCY1219]
MQGDRENTVEKIVNDKRLTSPTKISIIVSDLSTGGVGRWGGGAVRPFLLSQVLKRLNCDVEILGFNVQKDTAELSYFDDIPIQTIPGSNYPGFIKAANQLRDRINGDIIYAYKLRPSSFGLGLLEKFRTQRPLLLDIDDWELSWHGGDRWRYRPPNPKQFARDILKKNGQLRYPDHPLYLKWIEKWVSKADVVTLHNKFLQNRFGGVYLPNGKDTSLFDPSAYDPDASRKRYGLSDYRVLMFPGAPRPYKGVEDILIALDRLNEPDLRLVIIGGSPYDDYDNQLLDRWGRWIIKLPAMPIQLMPEVVSAAHIVVVPQRDEPAAVAQFPLKLTDGMAMAKPILATRVGDIPEILGDRGYLVEPSSPEQIAQKIQWIFQHWNSAIEQGKKAREKCVQYYSFEKMTEIMSEILSQVLK